MKYSVFTIAAITAAASSLLVGAANLDPAVDLDSLGNNTLFTKWRPTFHFTGPAGWMNDPCGAMYDPHRDEYHLMYQWHSNHVQWGNVTWGHAVSKDLITWTDVGGWRNDEATAIAPGPDAYDKLSVFSGTAQPYNLTGGRDGTLLAFYTAVSALPTNWALPYINGTEKQAFALSHDGGRTWGKYEGNPVIPHPPSGWNVTGWRDPFFQPWPEMDSFLAQEEPHFYMVLGSGIKGVGPRLPFYSAPASDLTDWTFLGALWEPRMNESFGDVEVTGSWGFNFEVSGFFSLTDGDGVVHWYTTFGAEGGVITDHDRWVLWTEGTISKNDNGSVSYDVISSGVSDWGNLYAVTSFWDEKNSRRISWGWSEEDMNSYGVHAQGYQGSMALPRELSVKTIKSVLNPSPSSSSITTKNSFTHTQNSDGTFTLSTLGIKPAADVVNGLRANSTFHVFPGGKKSTSELLATTNGNVASDHFELSTTISYVLGPVGFTIRASPDGQELTRVIFNPSANRISVDRSNASLISQFADTENWGSYTPLNISCGGEVKTEDLEFDIFVDGSLVEVFVGGRFALTTRVYPSRDDAMNVGLYVPEGSEAVFGDVRVWTGLLDVWPERPLNSSSALVWDSPEVTDDGNYWVGW
ncbi:hypothetical protein RUND412_005369 [Rhizina undulata]